MSSVLKQNYSQLNTVFKHVLSKFLTESDKHRLLIFDRAEDFNITVFLGVDLSYDDNHALRYASEEGRLSVVKHLVENGADIHADKDYAVRYASEEGHLDVIKYLVEKGANIREEHDYALVRASIHGCLPVVQYLVENGANIRSRNDCALIYACQNGHLPVVKYLVEKGAYIHTSDRFLKLVARLRKKPLIRSIATYLAEKLVIL